MISPEFLHYSVKFLNLINALMPQGLDFSPDNDSIIAYSLILSACVTGKIALAAKLSDLLLHLSFVSIKVLLPRVRINQRIVHLVIRTLPLTLLSFL